MAYKVALLCLLLTAGCASMASAYSTDSTSCYIYEACGWKPSDCKTSSPPTSQTPITLIVDACVDVVLVGKINAVIAVAAVIALLLKINLVLCAQVILALIAHVSIKAKIVALALIKVCAMVDVDKVALVNLFIKLGKGTLIDLCVALGPIAAVDLLVALCGLLTLKIDAYVALLAGCFNGLYLLSVTVWAKVLAIVCIKVNFPVITALLEALKVLNLDCLDAILRVCLGLAGGRAFVCKCAYLLAINILGIVICI